MASLRPLPTVRIHRYARRDVAHANCKWNPAHNDPHDCGWHAFAGACVTAARILSVTCLLAFTPVHCRHARARALSLSSACQSNSVILCPQSNCIMQSLRHVQIDVMHATLGLVGVLLLYITECTFSVLAGTCATAADHVHLCRLAKHRSEQPRSYVWRIDIYGEQGKQRLVTVPLGHANGCRGPMQRLAGLCRRRKGAELCTQSHL